MCCLGFGPRPPPAHVLSPHFVRKLGSNNHNYNLKTTRNNWNNGKKYFVSINSNDTTFSKFSSLKRAINYKFINQTKLFCRRHTFFRIIFIYGKKEKLYIRYILTSFLLIFCQTQTYLNLRNMDNKTLMERKVGIENRKNQRGTRGKSNSLGVNKIGWERVKEHDNRIDPTKGFLVLYILCIPRIPLMCLEHKDIGA